jgi:DnaJ-domain-containing protein 1
MPEKTTLFKKRTAPDAELRELMDSLSSTQREMAQAYDRFNFASDPDLIDACVYEINALQCRYNYLLRRVKAHRDYAPALLPKEAEA